MVYKELTGKPYYCREVLLKMLRLRSGQDSLQDSIPRLMEMNMNYQTPHWSFGVLLGPEGPFASSSSSWDYPKTNPQMRLGKTAKHRKENPFCAWHLATLAGSYIS